MRYAIPNGGAEDGVRLVSNSNTPFPTGAIHPVLNWSSLMTVLEKYRIEDAGTVREMTQTEKDDADEGHLYSIKEEKIAEVSQRTQDAFALGFTYEAKQFSLTDTDKISWLGLKEAIDLGVLPAPFDVTALDGSKHTFTDVADFSTFFATGMGMMKYHHDINRDYTLSVNDATTLAEVLAVVDPRV